MNILRNSVCFLLIGFVCAQERSISGATSRRNRFSAGKPQAVNFNCPEDFGYYAHPTDCSQYYVCVFGGALLESCTGGLMYSTELQTCDWPRNVVCKASSGPGVSTVKITDPRTRSTDTNSIHSATESLSSSSIVSRGVDNTIRNTQPLKSSGISKAIFEDPSEGRQGRFVTIQEDPHQRIDNGFQAQETSSRAFNVVPSAAATPNSKLTFPPSLPGQSRFPSVRSSTTSPKSDNLYADILNSNDTDYYYYYDDILYDDYYDQTAKKTTTKAPVVRSSSRSRGKKGSKKSAVSSSGLGLTTLNSRGRGATNSRASSSSSNSPQPSSQFSSFNNPDFSSSFPNTFAASRFPAAEGEGSSSTKSLPSSSSSSNASKSRKNKKESSRTAPSRPPANRHQPHIKIPERASTEIPNTNNLTTIATTTTSPTYRNALYISEPNTTFISQTNSSKVEFVSNKKEPNDLSPSSSLKISNRNEIPEENEEDNEIPKVKRLAQTKSEIDNDNFNTNGDKKDNTHLKTNRKPPFPYATITVALMRNRGRSIGRNPISINPRILRLSNASSPLPSKNQRENNGGRNTNKNRRITNTVNGFSLRPNTSRNLNPTSQNPLSFRQRQSSARLPNRQTNIFENRRTSLNKRLNPVVIPRHNDTNQNNRNEDSRRIHVVKKVSTISSPPENKNEPNDKATLTSKSSSNSTLGKSTSERLTSRIIAPPVPVRIRLKEEPFTVKPQVSNEVSSRKVGSVSLPKTTPILRETNKEKKENLKESKIVSSSVPSNNIIPRKTNNTTEALVKKLEGDKVPKTSLRISDIQSVRNTRPLTRGNNNSVKLNISENLVTEIENREESKSTESKKNKLPNKTFKPSSHSLKIVSREKSKTEKVTLSNQKNNSEKLSTNNSKPSSATITFAQLKSTNNSFTLSNIQPNKYNTSSNFTDVSNNKSRLPLLPSSLLQSSHKNSSKPKIPESLDETSSNSSSNTGLDRGTSRNKPKAPSKSSPQPGAKPQLVGRTPQRLVRPSKKPLPASMSSGRSVDIWKYPPRRPNPLYPQPQVDLPAAPCDPTICKLPDCYCGGKAIPGNIPPQNVPQMVLLTFDDSVNDLNKNLYIDLFEKGRVNPNGCPISATFYISHEWTDYSQVQNLYSDGHEIASHSITHSFGEQFSTTKWAKEIGGQREIMSAYGGVRMEDIRGMRAPFLAVGGNNMFRMLYDLNFTYDSSMPVYENNPPSWPYTLDYKIFHDCMIPPCPTHSFPGVWQVPMVMWQDLTGGRCSMGDACTTPPDAEGVYKMLIKNFERHYTTNRSPFGLFYHAAWFTTPHHKEGFIAFLDTIAAMDDVWLVTNWQALQWVRDPTPLSTVKSFAPLQCDYPERPPRCTTPKVCNVWHKGSVRYMKTCQSCPESYPWTGSTGVPSPLNNI